MRRAGVQRRVQAGPAENRECCDEPKSSRGDAHDRLLLSYRTLLPPVTRYFAGATNRRTLSRGLRTDDKMRVDRLTSSAGRANPTGQRRRLNVRNRRLYRTT